MDSVELLTPVNYDFDIFVEIEQWLKIRPPDPNPNIRRPSGLKIIIIAAL